MNMKSVLRILVVSGAALTSATASSFAHSPGQYGQGPGPGMMGPGMMGPGMMGPGMGPGSMAALPEDLSVENVRHMLEHQLAWHGNPNLKLGKVEEQDEDAIVAEIVTQDGSVVQRLQVDRHTGMMQPTS